MPQRFTYSYSYNNNYNNTYSSSYNNNNNYYYKIGPSNTQPKSVAYF